MESAIIATITNPANIVKNGTTTTITFLTADLLAYYESLAAVSNANIAKYNAGQTSLTSQSAVYTSEIANENTNIANDNALIAIVS